MALSHATSDGEGRGGCAGAGYAGGAQRRALGGAAGLVLTLALAAAVLSLAAGALQVLAARSPSVSVQAPLPPPLPLRPALSPDLPILSDGEGRPAWPAPKVRPAEAAAPGSTPGSEEPLALARAAARGDRAALGRLGALAQGGAPAAQLLLAKLYETGPAGAPRDLALAREWTRRAAAGGDRAAMYNLGVFLMTGEGGPPDAPAAARWFERAAKAGVVDAEFNLALLYENGRGVPKNLVEAYRWYSIAANAGDGLARERAITLESKLTRNERAAAADQVGGFQPGRPAAEFAVPVIPPAATVAESQRLLAREGRFIGPTDGADTPAYRAAAAAYLQDHPQARRLTLAP